MKDFRNREIVAGDRVIYAVKHSTFVQLNEGVVTATGEKHSPWNYLPPFPFIMVQRDDVSRLVRVVNGSTVVVVG